MEETTIPITTPPPPPPPLPLPYSDELKRMTDACIPRVPVTVYQANPDSFTPQMLLIGPLQHPKKKLAREVQQQNPTFSDGKTLKERCDMYLMMEKRKTVYREAFARRFDEHWVERSKEYVMKYEKKIRGCYAEPTLGIKTEEFVDMILGDAIFIMEIFIKYAQSFNDDPLISYLLSTVYLDLILLENQLPYFLLEDLYDQIITSGVPASKAKINFRDLTLHFFRMEDLPSGKSFKHFTDLVRVARAERLDGDIKSMPLRNFNKGQENAGVRDLKAMALISAEKLKASGIDFSLAEQKEGQPLHAELKGRNLAVGGLVVDSGTEITLSNVIALESLCYKRRRFVSSYVQLLGFLIKTERDLGLLEEEGIIKGRMGYQGSVADMVRRLNIGLNPTTSCYDDVVVDLMQHYNSSWKRRFGVLRRIYFADIWKGTATVAAVILVVFGAIQTVTSTIQLLKY